jgi:ATP-dependent DNA ligase
MLQRSGRVAGPVEPCLPSPTKAPPSGPDWLHEIKHDGFRILARRDEKGVRLFGRSRMFTQCLLLCIVRF